VVFATGIMVQQSIQAAKQLKEEGYRRPCGQRQYHQAARYHGPSWFLRRSKGCSNRRGAHVIGGWEAL
jgi:hypothetical protein